ncbi:hypothetical protein [uncultured Azohydromonas sp.]|nr:hypothetical protein [uncultured Azohydromonas sp.]
MSFDCWAMACCFSVVLNDLHQPVRLLQGAMVRKRRALIVRRL